MDTHSKHIMELLQTKKILFANISKIWGNTDGRTEKYRCATALYLLSMLTHTYNIIIDRGVGSSGHVQEDVSGFNATYERLL